MDAMSMALSSLDMASSSQMMQYSVSVTKKVMDNEVQSAEKLLEMIPQQPQPGSTPAIPKGQYIDVYA